MSGKLKFLAGLNVVGWVVVVPLLVASLLDPFVDFGNWPGGFVVDSRGGAGRLAEVDSPVRSAAEPRSGAAIAGAAAAAPAVPVTRALGPAGAPVLTGTIVTPRRAVELDTRSRSGLRRQARRSTSSIRAPQRPAPAHPPAAPVPAAPRPEAAAASAPARRPGRSPLRSSSSSSSRYTKASSPTRSTAPARSSRPRPAKRVVKAPPAQVPPAHGKGKRRGPGPDKPDGKPAPQAVEAPKVETPTGPDDDETGKGKNK